MSVSTTTRLWRAITGDLLRQQRYQIITIAVAITAIYILIFYFLPGASQDKVVQFLIFNDPVALGMLFTGSMFLFEKNEHTLDALSVTPLRAGEYIGAKVVTFSLLGLGASLCMAVAAWGLQFSFLPLLLGVTFTASLFTMLGLVLVVDSRSFNEYVIRIGIWMVPVALPLLNFFGLTDSFWFYLIPTQPVLSLLEASRTIIPNWELIYAIVYLLVCNVGAFYWAKYRLSRKVGFN
jgi:fluoroquinolone transport system permease protein